MDMVALELIKKLQIIERRINISFCKIDEDHYCAARNIKFKL
jgi:hypothetical protein